MRYSAFDGPPIEFECRVQTFKGFFPKGPTDKGGHREDDLIQVWCDNGMRTIGLSNIYKVR